MEIILNEISKIVKTYSKTTEASINEEMAFNYLTLWYYFLCNELKYKATSKSLLTLDYNDIQSYITDGANDGGIDYVYFDDEESIPRVFVCQSKYCESLDYNTIIAELDKMSNTVEDFLRARTSRYNSKLKRELQNALDRLPEQGGEVEYVLFTKADVDTEKILRRIEENENPKLTKENVSIYSVFDIKSKITSILDEILTVGYDFIKIDRAKNYLEYENFDTKGVMVNISSNSIVALHNKYKDKGLFDLNIRRYIKNKMVDDGIKKSLDLCREDFWFLNNGIIIACKDYQIDGNTVKLYDFSIVNGGQTTNLIGEFKAKSNDEFYLPCKIVSKKDSEEVDYEFFNRVAEATNSQKPIYARDLKSNSQEMRRLQKWLSEEGIYLEIKRGIRIPRNKYAFHIKNDELGQILFSFVHQKPGTARSNKKELFENSRLYGQIFKVPYERDRKKKDCIVDIIKLNQRYDEIANALLKSNEIDDNEKIILKNGKLMIFATLGLLYMWANKDLTPTDTRMNPTVVHDVEFVYSKIIGHYHKDDIDEILKKMIVLVVGILQEEYEKAYSSQNTTSVSNYFKKDTTYINDIVPTISKQYERSDFFKNDINNYIKIFKRDE